MHYIPERFWSEVELLVSKLKRYEIREKMGEEERSKKKKKKKEINKKEEKLCVYTRKTLRSSALKKQHTDDCIAPTQEEVQMHLDLIGENRFSGSDFVKYYNCNGWLDKGGLPIKDWRAKVDCWISRKNAAGAKKMAKDGQTNTERQKVYRPESDQPKVYRPRDQYCNYPVFN